MRLSHSSVSKYTLCPRKYKYHYIDRYRGTKIPSPLFFGSALDEAFSHLLATKKSQLTEQELTLQLTETPESLFEQKMLQVSSNGEIVALAQSPLADYFASDFTPELLNKVHLKQLQSLEPAYSLVDFIDFHLQCKEQLRARKKLQTDDTILYNYMTWLSLVEKGKLMISAYKTDVMPQISKVFDIQKSISLKNADNDEITGLIDFTAEFVDTPGTTYVCDNKSSGEAYSDDSVEQSEQLAVYCEAEKVNTAAYVVVQKKLFKRSPVIRTQVIKSIVPESTFVKTFDTFEQIVYNIERQKFPKNEKSCFSFGRKCEYYSLCHHGSMSGILKV